MIEKDKMTSIIDEAIEKALDKVSKIPEAERSTVLSPEKLKQYENSKKEMSYEYYNKVQLKKGGIDKKTGEQKYTFTGVTETPEEKRPMKRIKSPKPSDEKKSVDKKLNKLQYELKHNPISRTEQVINDIPKSLDEYSASQKLNIYKYNTSYGKEREKVIGNTSIVRSIEKIASKNFGSIGDYDIDTIPRSLIRCKGTEVTYITDVHKMNKNKQLVSRRFCSKVLSTWCWAMGIKYIPSDRHINGIELWGIKIPGIKEVLINPTDCGYMIKDLIFLMRNKSSSIDDLLDELRKGNISHQLYDVIMHKRYTKQTTVINIVNDIKVKISYLYNYSTSDVAWDYTKWNPEYLIKILDRLHSGEYFTDILVPAIIDLWKYPIKCTDTGLKQMTDEEHQKNTDDYDITQYVWEREQ